MNSAKQLVTDYQTNKLHPLRIDRSTRAILVEVSIWLKNINLSFFVNYVIAFYNEDISLNDR